jgi:hypothetical protein
MKIDVSVPDFKKILVKFEGLPKKINDNVIDVLVESASDIRNEMIDSMESSPPIGRSYKRGGKTHIASAPGYPPRRDSGDLQGSFELDINESDGTVEIGSVIRNPDYPMFLEKGFGDTASVYFMAPRPYMQPAVDKYKPIMEDRVMRAIKSLVK